MRPLPITARKPTPLALLLLLAVLSSTSGAAGYGSGQYGEKHPFMESMKLMMDAMGLDKSAGGGSDWWRSAPNQSFSGSPWNQTWPGMMSSMPGATAGQQMMRQMPGSNSPWYPLAASELDGVWQGQGGDLLEIRGDRFRLAGGAGRHIEGQLRTQGNVISMRNARTEATRSYEYAVHQGRLALRDPYGQLMLYRRVPEGSQNPSGWSDPGWNY